MTSQNNTVISLPGQEITDAAGNLWSIANGQVAVNGAIDPTTSNVIEMAYENGLVWQKNTDNLWWSKTAPDAQWSPPLGTSTDPIPNQHASLNNAILVASATGIILDSQFNEWTIANGQVLINGVPDSTTARVVQLVYSGGEVWQENADGLWWAKSSPNGSWNPPTGTTQAPTPDAKAETDTVVVTLSSVAGPLTDASGNQWAIVNGQVTLNGIADQTTQNVTELAYVNGRVWQENSDGLWWSKAKPSDTWYPPYGTPQTPVAATTKLWIGDNANFGVASDWSPGGVPKSGNTAVIASGDVLIDNGAASGVNFDMQGGTADFRSGSFTVGKLSGTGSIDVSYADTNASVTTTGINLSGDHLAVTEFAAGGAHYAFAVSGNSQLNNSTLAISETGTASLPLGAMENDGKMTLNDSTLRVGQLTGSGSVVVTNNSTVAVQTGSASTETIQLKSGHLNLGGYPNASANSGLSFLAPVTNFGSESSISLLNTVATQEIFKQTTPTAGEMMLYNGSTLVADLHLSGQSHFYASYQPAGTGPSSVLITAYDTGHSLPVVSHVS